MNNYLTLGRIFFAGALIGSGLQQLVRQEFVRLVPKLPSWIPWSAGWAWLTGALLVVAGLAILADRKRRPAAMLVVGLFFVVLLLYVPGVIANPGAGYVWTNPCKTLALLGGALLLAVTPVDQPVENFAVDRPTFEHVLLLVGVCFGVFLVICGVQHFVYAGFVDQLVPAWIPVHRFWTYFTGTALIAGGVGVNLRPTTRTAAILAGLMIFLWVPLLHIPRAMANLQDPRETSGIFEALALSGVAFFIAGVATTGRVPRSIN